MSLMLPAEHQGNKTEVKQLLLLLLPVFALHKLNYLLCLKKTGTTIFIKSIFILIKKML